MKKRQQKRKVLGKISTYLRMKGFSHGGQSEQRARFKGTNLIPNSTKSGGGQEIHRIRSVKQLSR